MNRPEDHIPPEGARIADRMAGIAGQEAVPKPDPVQVQGKLHAYLLARGRQVAQDKDLPQTSDENLVELGRLDCVGKYPTLHPNAACTLEMVAAERHARRQGGGHTLDLDKIVADRAVNPYGPWPGRYRHTSNDGRLDQLLAQAHEQQQGR